MQNDNKDMEQPDLFEARYDSRFLDRFLGNMAKNPIVAITELLANTYDAGATEVHISWPKNKDLNNPIFKIEDNGEGLTIEEFTSIWSKLNYDRIKNQGSSVSVFDKNGDLIEKRDVFGKNGKGRFSAFCFNDYYEVVSTKNGKTFSATVKKSTLTDSSPLLITNIKNIDSLEKKGIVITTPLKNLDHFINESNLRKELSARFISRLNFKIYINQKKLSLNDIPSNCLIEKDVDFKGHKIKIRLIDTNKIDTSTKQRGVAWWVKGRLVGGINWSFLKSFDEFDQRKSTAKKMNLIIEADCLHSLNLVLDDWSGFDLQNNLWQEFEDVMIPCIKELMNEPIVKSQREKANTILGAVWSKSSSLSRLSQSRITTFVDDVVASCPTLSDKDLYNVTNVLINLEKSSNKYNLLQKLANISFEELDKLNSILEDWGVDMAKIILDEIEGRLKTIAEFESRINVLGVKEVQELQTLFNNGLWMFGANFEAIDFSSNKGMTKVFKNLFGINQKGSLNRPDYVILPEAFSRPKFDDENYEEIGVDQVIIVDLKTTGLTLGSDEKNQIWKYIKELESKGAITKTTKVYGFILGDKIESGENSTRKEWDDHVVITPLLYSTLLSRAKNRMLKLSDKVSAAPILKNHMENEKQRLSEAYNQSLLV